MVLEALLAMAGLILLDGVIELEGIYSQICINFSLLKWYSP